MKGKTVTNLPTTNQTRDVVVLDQEKMDIIRKTVAASLTQPEFEFFIAVAKARALDPLLGQIHAVKRKAKVGRNPDRYEDRLTIQVGIDGFRVIAARTGEYAGCDKTLFEYNEAGQLLYAEVTVYRFVQGQRCGFTGSADWSEFYPGEAQGYVWNNKPKVMLGKCAEAQALRKAFPNDLAGLYEPAEVDQLERDANEAKDTQPTLATPVDPFEEKVKEVISKFRKIGVSEDMVCRKLGLDYAFEMSEAQLAELNNIGAAITREGKKVADFFEVKT